MLGEFINFYGMPWRETIEMPVPWFMKLYNRISMIEARRLIPQLNVISYPHMTEEGRENIHASLMRQSGYERMRQEALEREQYEANWDILRRFGRPAVQSPS